MTLRLCRIHLSRAFAAFLRAKAGTAALEFAFVAPALIGVVLVLADVANIAMGAADMQTAVRAGVQYAQNGGSELAVAQNLATQAWINQPAGSTLNAQTACKCGAAANACDQPCPDGTVPATYVTVTAVATLGGSVISTNKTTSETVRVR